MEQVRTGISYLEWGVIIGLTILLFAFFSLKFQKIGSLLTFVLIPTWIIAAIMKGSENLYFDNANELSSFYGLSMLLAESLPMVLIFGGITFWIKYKRFKKTLQ